MDPNGRIYELTDEEQEALNGELTEDSAKLREDTARYEGYKRAFEEATEALKAADRAEPTPE